MGKNWAIAIGINKYSYLEPLDFAKTDAEAMSQWLLKEGDFDREGLFLFTDDSPPIATDPPIPTNPTFGHLDTFFDVQFERRLLTSADNLWFFFSGHGNRGAAGDYLMLSDSNPRRLEKTALSVSYITERLRNWGAGNVVMFIDACRNVEDGSKGGEIATEDYQGIIAFYSCRTKEKSLEIKAIERGAFTHVLLQSLEITKKQNRCLTVAELENCLMGEVPKLSPNQHPLARVEPTYKRDFVLFGEAGKNDVESLKNLAYRKCFEGKNEEAKELLIHANLVAKGGDFEVIDALFRLHSSAPVSIPPPPPSSQSSQKRKVEPIQIPKIKESQPEIELKSEKGVDYRKLRDFLATRQWRKANEETAKVMCQVSNRENEGWLREEDIDGFPCQDLQTINQLWLHYSAEQFGFSVQKEIYEHLGGTRKYNSEVWKKFGERVGWKRGKEYLNYDDLTYNLNAPKAHLPLEVGAGMVSSWYISSLVQRLISCNIKSYQPQSEPKNLSATIEIKLKSKKGVDYSKLHDFLAEGQWQEADRETGRVMCQAVDKISAGQLTVKDIDFFPCEDLQTINQLWLHYSNNKFGFSIQKEIYTSLGGAREYNRKIWIKFCDCVGWRNEGEWLNYSDLTFDYNRSLKAHLPSVIFRWWGFSALIQRLATCKI